MFVLTFDSIKKEEDLQAFLSGYEPCTEGEFEGIREKGFAWLDEYLYKYGVLLKSVVRS